MPYSFGAVFWCFAVNIEFEILAFALSEVRFPTCCMEAVGVSEPGGVTLRVNLIPL